MVAEKCKYGERHPRAKLTDHDVELIRRLVERDGLTVSQVALKFDITKGYCSRLVRYHRR